MEKFPQAPGEKTRDLAAKKSGFGNSKTYEQAKAVVEAAAEEPERFGKLQANMDRTGHVTAIHRYKPVSQPNIPIMNWNEPVLPYAAICCHARDVEPFRKRPFETINPLLVQ